MSGRSKTEQIVFETVEETIIKMGLDLVGVEYKRESNEWFLRIIIDKQGGVSLDDCADVSTAIEPMLEDMDVIKLQYNLEVSSPGVDKPFVTQRDFERNIGCLVEVHPILPKGQKKWEEGILQSVTDDEITIVLDEPFVKGVRPKTNGQIKQFIRKEIKFVRKAIRF